jgi:hypothetical protein
MFTIELTHAELCFLVNLTTPTADKKWSNSQVPLPHLDALHEAVHDKLATALGAPTVQALAEGEPKLSIL